MKFYMHFIVDCATFCCPHCPTDLIAMASRMPIQPHSTRYQFGSHYLSLARARVRMHSFISRTTEAMSVENHSERLINYYVCNRYCAIFNKT